ncbi:hypothetical protein HY29_00965 [Hyphomonas beringensis]|uniref:ATP-grasp domain-containing protein n=1 Tax=Hyphomonas beringensis TaxID=1280946 RepID=A0A062UAC7_9PROT|nr:hypothetical protein [Hyphomonas beringensis]KCZ57326.1 hypothetical protein HY29_00965 [Hyphomonas beringensis]
MTKSNILVVAHGEKRGRCVPTGDAFLRRLATTDNPLLVDMRLHRTGTGKPDLSDISLVIFWLGDPLKQKYPECYLEALEIAKAAQDAGIKIVNHPDALSLTTKSRQARIWQEHDVPAAKAVAVQSPSELNSAIEKVGFPCLIRSDQEHAQRNVIQVDSKSDVERITLDDLLPAVVLKCHDVREEYRRAGWDADSLFYRFHHKARAIVFQDRVIGSHLFFSKDRIVGLSNSLFAREERPRRNFARRFGYHRQLLDEMIAVDKQYFSEVPQGHDDLVRAVSVMGLDFAALDYSLRPDGSILIWEANPYFHLPDGRKSVLSAERDAVARVNKSFDWIAENFARLKADKPALTIVSSQ